MRKVLLLLSVIVLLVSCDGQGFDMPGGEGWIRITMAEKHLEADTDSLLAYYEYKAEALFGLEGNHPLRGETDWRRVGAVDGESDMIGPFSQGYWRISIHACNRGGSILYTDVKEVYIAESHTAYIVFDATRGTSDGTVSVDISVPRTTAGTGLSVSFNDGVAAHGRTVTSWTMTQTETETRYTGSVDLPAGSYVAVFSVPGAGEAISVEVLAGETAHVTGTLYPSAYPEGNLTVVTPDESRAHITASGHWIEVGHGLALTLVRDKGSFTTADWYVNGEKKGTGMSWTFTPDEPGIYEIVAFVYTRLSQTNQGNSTGAVVFYETSTSASFTVRATVAQTSVRVNRAQIVDAGSSGTIYNESNQAVSFPYTANVVNVHADGRYTLYELGLHK